MVQSLSTSKEEVAVVTIQLASCLGGEKERHRLGIEWGSGVLNPPYHYIWHLRPEWDSRR